MQKVLKITPDLEEQIRRVRRASALYPNADDGWAPLEQEELALARAVLRACALQRLDRPRPVAAHLRARAIRRRA